MAPPGNQAANRENKPQPAVFGGVTPVNSTHYIINDFIFLSLTIVLFGIADIHDFHHRISLGHTQGVRKMKNFCFGFVVLALLAAPPAFAKGGLGEIFGALIGGAVGKAVGRSAAGGMSVEQALVKVCDQVNKQLPMSVDKETRWDNTTPGPGCQLTYNYTFVNAAASDVDVNYFYQVMTQKLRNSVCTSADMKVFFKNNVTVSYSYRGRDGVHIGKIDITPRDCGYTP